MSTKEKEYTYQDFLESEETKAAAEKRKQTEASKPSSFSYGTYTQSDSVKQAQDKLNQHTQNKPGAYTSQWQTSLNDTLNKILNREKFNYDLNGDALYQQYKNQYTTQGMQAMMDTMGQAQSMTGGYGNSYAQTAGQQAYQGYLQQLNDKIPELYQLALNQYNREGEDLYNQYGLYADRENLDYNRYRDQLSDYNTELNRLTEDSRHQSETDYNRYMDQYNMAYGQYRDTVGDWQTEQDRADNNYWNLYNRDYSMYADALAQQNWQAEFDEAVRQFNFKNGIVTGGGTGTGGTGTGSGGGDADTLALQKQLNAMGANIAEDGIWGNETKAAYEKYIGGSTESTEAHVRSMSAAGENRNKIMQYINAKYQTGAIDQNEYMRLMSSYASAGM